MTDSTLETLVVREDEAGLRLDAFLAANIPHASRAQLQRCIGECEALVNGEAVRKNHRLRGGDRVTWNGAFIQRQVRPVLRAQDMALDVLYEDEHLLAINKPAGMVVHPGPGHGEGTLVNALLGRGGTLSEGSHPERPGIVHRLDRGTSGVLLVARTNEAHWKLGAMFAEREVTKTYAAFTIGKRPEDRGVIEVPVGRSRKDPLKQAVVSRGGREAVTEYWLLGYRYGIAALRLQPRTGRTHQIRVHCSYRGFPVLGDTLYGGGKEMMNRIPPMERPPAHAVRKCFDRAALHAHSISLKHPVAGRPLELVAPLPADFVCAERAFGDMGEWL